MKAYPAFFVKLAWSLIFCSLTLITTGQDNRFASREVHQIKNRPFEISSSSPSFAYNLLEKKINHRNSELFSQSASNFFSPPPYVIPVVVHIISQNPSPIT